MRKTIKKKVPVKKKESVAKKAVKTSSHVKVAKVPVLTIPRSKTFYYTANASKGPSLLAGINRAIRPAHVTTMCDSIMMLNQITRTVLIATISFLTGKPVDYIIDGQHLYNACLRLGIEVPYSYIKVKDKQSLIETIAKLNASSISWTLSDYVTAWSSLIPDYIFLNEMLEKYDIEIRTVMQCFSGGSDGSHTSTILKKGLFRIKDKELGLKFLDQITDCLKIAPRGNRWVNNTYVNACLYVMKNQKNYNHVVFTSYLRKHKNKLMFITQDSQAIVEFMQQAFK